MAIKTFEELKAFPYFERAAAEIDAMVEGMPESTTLPLKGIRELMITAWMRGAAWQSHDTN
jgi:hypothetical protein